MRGALRSVVLALVMVTGVSLYGFWTAFRWLYRHDEELRELRDRQRRLGRMAT